MRKIRVFVTILFMLATIVGCSSEKVNKSDEENDLLTVREFVGTEFYGADLEKGADYMVIKQDGYGVISEWIYYDENDEVTARIECKYEGIFMKERVTYDAEGEMCYRITYEREPDGKLINRKTYERDKLVSTVHYKEENDKMSVTDNATVVVRYDDLGRSIRLKSILEDGSESLTITEYDEYGLKSETTYLDGEVEFRMELVQKK